MQTFIYTVAKDYNEKYPRVHKLLVKEVPSGYVKLDDPINSKSRFAFNFRTRFGKDSYPRSREEAIRNFAKAQRDAIAQAKTDIAEAEFNLRAIERGIQ